MNNETLFSKFKEKAEAVSAEVHRFEKKNEAVSFITKFLLKEGIKDSNGYYALWADSAFLNGVDTQSLSEDVPGLYFKISKELASNAKIGISQMDWAIAVTGTLAQDAASVEQRMVSMLSEIHIAIVDTSKIFNDLSSVLSNFDAKKQPFLALVTGPSRTADIERVLTIGVHGPERLVIVFVDDAEGINGN